MIDIPFIGNGRERKEKEEILQSENRQKDFIRERDVHNAIINDDDPTIRQQSELNDLTRWQQDLTEDVDELVHDLRREVKVGDEWKPQYYVAGYAKDKEGNDRPVYNQLPPMMNELGIRTIISLMKPLLSRNLMMSNYDEERTLMKLRRVVSTVIIHLGYNHNIYGIEKKDLSAIVQMFRDVAEPTHFRALNNGERGFLTTTTKRLESHSQTPPQAKKKWGLFD